MTFEKNKTLPDRLWLSEFFRPRDFVTLQRNHDSVGMKQDEKHGPLFRYAIIIYLDESSYILKQEGLPNKRVYP